MTDYKFPTDLEFRKKAAYIADKVLYAINVANIKINPLHFYDINVEIYCPLGCINLEKEAPQPASGLASHFSNGILSVNDAGAFIRGYDDVIDHSIKYDPMYQLGKAYRKRFIK